MCTNTLAAAGATQVNKGSTPCLSKNPLLLRDDVGKPKPPVVDLPDGNFVYGRPTIYDEGVHEVATRWKGHVPSAPPPNPATSGAPDFKEMNRRSAVKGAVTGKDAANFRRTCELPPQRISSSPRVAPKLPSDLDSGYSYGHRVPRGEHIGELIANRYANMCEHELSEFYSQFHLHQEKERQQIRKIPLTKTSKGRAAAVRAVNPRGEDSPPAEPFKLTKFRRAGAKVDTNIRPKSNRFSGYDIENMVLTPESYMHDPMNEFE